MAETWIRCEDADTYVVQLTGALLAQHGATEVMEPGLTFDLAVERGRDDWRAASSAFRPGCSVAVPASLRRVAAQAVERVAERVA